VYVLFVFNLLVLVLDGHLVGFHIWLRCKDISTFDFIMYKREKREKDAQLQVTNTDNANNIFILF
jgi:hypothetical protein